MAYEQFQTNEQASRSRSARTHVAPALGLFFLAPLVGEFLWWQGAVDPRSGPPLAAGLEAASGKPG